MLLLWNIKLISLVTMTCVYAYMWFQGKKFGLSEEVIADFVNKENTRGIENLEVLCYYRRIRFVFNEYSEKHTPTTRHQAYFPSVIINDHLYEIKISDLPLISYFPVNSLCEWSDFRFYGLRNATAYVLVFDLSNVDSFQYVRTMREQMMESRDMKRVPLLIVGNKQDLVGGEVPTGGPPAILPPGADAAMRKRRDIVNLVRKHWKCSYVECSARHNLGVVSVFKELMEVIDAMDPHRDKKEVFSSPVIDNINEALDSDKCTIL